MDRNTVIGFVLIGAILFAYSWLSKPSDAQVKLQQRYNDSIALVEKHRNIAEQQAKPSPVQPVLLSDSAKAARFGSFAAAATGVEKIETLENELMEVKVSNKGGRVYSVRLKKYKTFDKKPLYLFNGDESSFNLSLHAANNQLVNTKDLYFTPVLNDSTITMRLNAGGSSYLDFVYTIRPKNYLMKFDIISTGMDSLLASNVNTMELKWSQKLRQQEKGAKGEDRYANLYYKFTTDDVEYLSDSKDDKKELTNKVKWIAYKDQFFSSVLIAQDPISSVNVSSKVLKEDPGYLKQYDADALIEFNAKSNKPISFSYYFGPNHYPTLRKLDKGIKNDNDKLRLDKIVPLGASVFRWINQIAVIPLFNFFEKFVGNYGLIILLLTLVIKLVLFPLTYKSYMSSAKMRVLRPQVEELNEKYPGQDKMMEKQRATMDLYKKVGVNPMSGCLPMLLQMPILFAMYMFFPSSIELRQQSFLWADDLSTYDSIISWTTHIPLVSDYYGNHVSLFCLLMTVTNIIYTKFNMDATNTGQAQMPGMKTIMYLMPVMFLFILNQFAAGLSYYYFISTLITILQTLAFRKFINEEKLLAKLHENAKKPAKKKSNFMARLEEAQKRQQEIVREQQKQRQKRK